MAQRARHSRELHLFERCEIAARRWTASSARTPLGTLCQRDHAGPELLLLRRGVDVILAGESELAVVADPIKYDRGRQRRNLLALAYRHRPDRGRHEQLAGRVDAEGPQI